jgi:hypothetical protein
MLLCKSFAGKKKTKEKISSRAVAGAVIQILLRKGGKETNIKHERMLTKTRTKNQPPKAKKRPKQNK